MADKVVTARVCLYGATEGEHAELNRFKLKQAVSSKFMLTFNNSVYFCVMVPINKLVTSLLATQMISKHLEQQGRSRS
jgi:hypothetical protein